MFAIWANRQLLETDTWVDTSTELLEDEEIRTVVADFMVDELFTAVDVEAQLQAALPPRAQPPAGSAGRRANLADDSPTRRCSGRGCRSSGRTPTAPRTRS